MKQLLKIRPNYLFRVMFTALILCTVTWKTAANDASTKRFGSSLTWQQEDSLKKLRPVTPVSNPRIDSIPLTDTTPKRKDSTRITRDTFAFKMSKDTLDAPVEYEAEDSAVILIQENKIILYGKTKIDYQQNSLQAPRIEIDQKTQVLTAVNTKDSTGAISEFAVFSDGKQTFSSDTIRFNFKTQRGITYNTYTEAQEGVFIFAKNAKRNSPTTTSLKGVRFSTCNLDEPHFCFVTGRMKVIDQKLAISGPTHPEFEGVPVPIILPFGFFPLSQGRHSGLLPPQFTTNEQMGLGLEGLGYYKVLNDYWDVKVYGNIYSYGGWLANLNPTYRKRYRYNGSFNLSMQSTKQAFKNDPDYVKNMSYFITWNHSVDSRARPGTTFSASVNAGSTKYNQYVPNNPQRNFNNQLGSSIAYTKTWKDKPFNLTLAANHNQNNATRLINVTLPDAGFTVNNIYPFQKKDFAGTQKWYEKLAIGYNGTFRNQVSFYDTAFKTRDLLDTLQWGAQHNIPITLSLPPILGGAILVSPSVSYSQVWIGQKVIRKWNVAEQKLDTLDVEKGLFIDHQASFGIGINTAIYGRYEVKNPKSKIIAFRHTMRPNLSLNYKPDLSRKYYYTDTIYKTTTTTYVDRLSLFAGSLFGGYAEGRSGGMSFAIDNNLEMKVRDSSQEKGSKIIRLIDGFGFSSGYNFLRDSLKLDYFNLYLRSNLFDKINISAQATLNPYMSDSIGRDIDQYAWQGGKFSPGRLTSGSISVSTSFKSKATDPEKEKQRQKEVQDNLDNPELRADQQRLLEYARQNPSEFVDFNIPWQINLSYSLNFYESRKPDYSGFEKKFSSNLNFNGSFNLTPKWNFSVNGYYDFDTKKLQTFTMSIAREMHCWQLSLNVTPIGLYRYFSLNISPKAGILQDLKINRTRSFSSY